MDRGVPHVARHVSQGARSGSSGGGAAGAAGTGPRAGCDLGYSELPDGKGGVNVEAVCFTPEMAFDKAA